MRFQSYFNTALKIITLYKGNVPLHHFLKKFFSENKKHGSADRKNITQACYNFFRLGFAFKNVTTEERLKISVFLCNNNAGGWRILYNEEWIENWSTQVQKRIYFIQSKYNFSIENIFPLVDEVSDDIIKNEFVLSHLIQPDVFLRIRNHHQQKVLNELNQHKITFEQVNDNCIALQPATKIETIIKNDEEVVIQDYSSQRVQEILDTYKSEIQHPKIEIQNSGSKIKVWDCCAGSGGKSILAFDVLHNIDLTVTDVRASIIQNLKQRFQKANIKNYKAFVDDISNPKSVIQNLKYDLIICDAPCTGSGTWSRTPEQLYFFKAEKIDHYSNLQQKIVSHAIKQLKAEGYFLYITCSVFAKENEAIVSFIQNNFNLTLIEQKTFKGYTLKADTMFAALLKN